MIPRPRTHQPMSFFTKNRVVTTPDPYIQVRNLYFLRPGGSWTQRLAGQDPEVKKWDSQGLTPSLYVVFWRQFNALDPETTAQSKWWFMTKLPFFIKCSFFYFRFFLFFFVNSPLPPRQMLNFCSHKRQYKVWSGSPPPAPTRKANEM